MNAEKLNSLIKNKQKIRSLDESDVFTSTRRKINYICRTLTMSTTKYQPEKSVETIKKYIFSSNKMERILYSEISNMIFSLNDEKLGNFSTNIDALLAYSLDENTVINTDVKKIVIKIYDHSHLALHQIENTTNILEKSINSAKIDLQETVKGMEREYISILGIFASIIIAFVGGMTFSTSVLNNIASVSIYRLLIVTDLLAFVLFNTIIILLKFIFAINGSGKDYSFKAKFVNCILLIFALLILIAWCFSIRYIPVFILKFLPWR